MSTLAKPPLIVHVHLKWTHRMWTVAILFKNTKKLKYYSRWHQHTCVHMKTTRSVPRSLHSEQERLLTSWIVKFSSSNARVLFFGKVLLVEEHELSVLGRLARQREVPAVVLQQPHDRLARRQLPGHERKHHGR